MRPDKFCNIVFPMVAHIQNVIKNDYVPVGFEKAMLEKVTKWFFKREMSIRNKYITTKA